MHPNDALIPGVAGLLALASLVGGQPFVQPRADRALVVLERRAFLLATISFAEDGLRLARGLRGPGVLLHALNRHFDDKHTVASAPSDGAFVVQSFPCSISHRGEPPFWVSDIKGTALAEIPARPR